LVEKRTVTLVTLAMLVWAATSTSLLGYYYLRLQEYEGLSKEYEKVTMRVNVLIDYGNETKVWHNNTIVSQGATLLNATKRVASVQTTYHYELQAVFIDTINGVPTTKTEGYWWWKYWDENSKVWKDGEMGADLYILKPDETVMWLFIKM